MELENKKPVIMLGGGGHASVLMDILLSQNRTIIAVFCPDEILNQSIFSSVAHFKQDEDILKFSIEDVVIVNGIGFLPRSDLRMQMTQKINSYGYEFETVIAKGATVSKFAKVEKGAQIFTGAVIQAGSYVGAHSIINTSAVIEHDCNIGAHSHVAPGAIICGQVTTGSSVFVGAGATVIQNLTIGDKGIVAASALLQTNLASNQMCYPDRTGIK